MATFKSLELDPQILSAITEAGYENPTEIQSAAIPHVLAGSDLMATASTGTGKTAAFSLPILHRMVEENRLKQQDEDNEKKPKYRSKLQAVILSPTRELAQQIEENLIIYAKNLPFVVKSVVGGLPIQKQIKAIDRGVDILVATPGRLLDLMNRGVVQLRTVNYYVLDEADRMLDMGFIHDVQAITRKLKRERQTLLFSATTSPEVKQLSSVLLKKPEHVAVDSVQSTAGNIEQRLYLVDMKNKRPLVLELLKDPSIERALIFTTTKANANVLASILAREGVEAEAIHSDKNQKARQNSLAAFEKGDVKILVATDVMARGIDIDGISHVINYELSNDPENFVHRVGRTARAGSSGVAISLCDLNEVPAVKSIESFLEEELPVIEDQPYHSPFVQTMKNQRTSPFAKRRRR